MFAYAAAEVKSRAIEWRRRSAPWRPVRTRLYV